MGVVLEVRPLSERDTCGGFNAGTAHAALNEFFWKSAKQNHRRRTSTTHIALESGTIAAYATILPCAVSPLLLPEIGVRLPRQEVPALLLARMATDERFQRRGIGEQLLHRAVFAEAVALADRFGCVGVLVDAKNNDAALRFYQKAGFIPLVDVTARDSAVREKTESAEAAPAKPQSDSVQMVLSMVSIRKVLAERAEKPPELLAARTNR